MHKDPVLLYEVEVILNPEGLLPLEYSQLSEGKTCNIDPTILTFAALIIKSILWHVYFNGWYL